MLNATTSNNSDAVQEQAVTAIGFHADALGTVPRRARFAPENYPFEMTGRRSRGRGNT